MSKIVDFWNAVVTEIADKVPTLKEVRLYRGEFEGTEKQKAQIATKNPAALVAVSAQGAATKLSDGRLQIPVNVAIAIVADDRGRRTDTTVAEIAEEIIGVVHQNRFRIVGQTPPRFHASSDPDNFAIVNWNSAETLDQGLSVWGVAWEQAVIIGAQQTVDFLPFPTVPPGSNMSVTNGFEPAASLPTSDPTD